MNTEQIHFRLALAIILVILVTATPIAASTDNSVDHRLFGELLKAYVADGRVDYAGFQSEEAKLDQYLDLLQRVEISSLSRNEQMAFYTNLYNAWTIKLILSKYPEISSIKALGIFNSGPWKKKVVRLKGETVSLDHIEHDILRPRYKDPRIHFAINCAAKSCPPLRSEPYSGDRLDQQLDDSTRSFINNPRSYRWEGRNLYVSRIFKWFSEDFNEDVLAFFRQYADGELKENLDAASQKINVQYLEYDWSLNRK